MNDSMQRRLGRSEIPVSAMGLGCWAIGGQMWRDKFSVSYGKTDDDESMRAIDHALELGVNFFDTADAYGTGHSEVLLGQVLSGKRDKVVIATKFSTTFDEKAHRLTGFNASPEYIRSACDASLKRLNTDYIDLYQLHHPDPGPDEAKVVRDVLEELVSKGKIRAYGWSTGILENARFFAEKANCTAIQHQMNVLDDAAGIIALCEKLDLASINRGPLAMGLLSGKYNPDRKLPPDDVRGEKGPDWVPYFEDGKPKVEWFEKLQAIRDILTTGGRSLVQGALAWIWARSEKTIPIPGFKTVAQIEENCGAMKFGPLNDDEMAQISSLLGR